MAAASAFRTQSIRLFLAVISVRTKPGQIAVTATFFDRSEMRMLSRYAFRPDLLAQYAAAVGSPLNAATLETPTRCPDVRASMSGRTASKAYIGPRRFVRITFSAPTTF